MPITLAISWICQLYLAFFFLRSSFRKARNFDRVSAEFRGWGYPFSDQITYFLIAVWILCSVAILVPEWAGASAVVLLAFMIIASLTLLWNGEILRLVEPARPIVPLVIVIFVRWSDIAGIAG